ncbi:protein FAR1-RELATED SEQUENCE 5-like [Arachis ipaensis]|uniref:protein FAR1-RELATED SEQUENCE 5-like n=1 Tax=Arachis ipaensis TaxID=130454 RepID=UPI000A2B29AB|nr:protein FAR1-RELATED SEQUENCE 5-like [Arachis ipaensis]
MQHDYDCFGDVLAFDSTYRKNLYNRPLVIISGTNHHRQTIIFGFGLLEDEKIPSYKWLLRSFLDVMRQKEPMVVVTDGDKSMKKAIRSEFPNATHRPCSWHLAWNVVSNIKDANFCSAFKTAVYGNFVVEEFENYWAEMVESFGLENNDWIEKTYEKRAQWANAYLCDKFCARVRTTLRCEGINSSLKKFIRSGNCLLELVENLDRVVKDYQNNEFMADFKCLYSEPVMTTGLESIEKAVSKVYTREIFFEVKKQIESVAALLVLHHETYGTIQKFMLRKFRRPLRVYTILYNSSSKNYECSCKLWNSLGVPCSHIFCAMKELEIEALPRRLVLRRSCKDAKTLEKVGAVPMADPEKAFRERYGSMWSACMSMCYIAA